MHIKVLILALYVLATPASYAQKDEPDGWKDQLIEHVKVLTSRINELESQVAMLQAQAHDRYTDGEAQSIAQEMIGIHAMNAVAHHGDSDPGGILNFFTREGSDIYLENANLHVRNGIGQTNAANGLGNLIVGYNEIPSGNPNGERSGSHMIVVGRGHSFTGYGGLVVGAEHQSFADFASITGGEENTITGRAASISGGFLNTAGGARSVITGGALNGAFGTGSVVHGGYDNGATGTYSGAYGGSSNEAVGAASSVHGGSANFVYGQNSSIHGGQGVQVQGDRQNPDTHTP